MVVCRYEKLFALEIWKRFLLSRPFHWNHLSAPDAPSTGPFCNCSRVQRAAARWTMVGLSFLSTSTLGQTYTYTQMIPMYLKVRHMAKHFLAFHSQLLGFYFWSLVTEVGFVFTSRCLPHFCSYFAWPTNGPRCLWANAFLSVTNYDSAEVLFLAASSTICHLEPQTGAAEKGWPEIVFHASCAICIDFVWQEEILQRFWRPRGAAYMCKGIVQPSKLAKYFGCSFPKGGVPPQKLCRQFGPKTLTYNLLQVD